MTIAGIQLKDTKDQAAKWLGSGLRRNDDQLKDGKDPKTGEIVTTWEVKR